MAHINFDLPSDRKELLSSSSGSYEVKDVTVINALPAELKRAKIALKDEGAEYIISTFDTYYSVLQHFESLTADIIHTAYTDLHTATIEMNKALGFLLEDKENLEGNEEIKAKYVNIMKMILYLYTQLVVMIEHRNIASKDQSSKRKKSQTDDAILNKKAVLLSLNNVIQRDISLFWETVVEEKFINLIANTCYEFLQNPAIKNDKDEIHSIFCIFGHLITSYSYGTTFILRLTQLIKMYEHLSICAPIGIKQLIVDFNVKGLLHELIEELTEWQTDEKTQDMQGSKYCSIFLSNLAGLVPKLMMPEVRFLNNYLHHDPPSLRISVLTVMAEVILNNLTGEGLGEEMLNFRQELFQILLEHTNDNAAVVRAKVIQLWAKLQQGKAIPLEAQNLILGEVVLHLHDKGVLVRKCAANCVLTFLTYNFYGKELSLAAAEKVLDEKSKKLKEFQEKNKDPKVEKLLELQAEWDKKKEKIHDLVRETVESAENGEDTAKNIALPSAQEFPDKIRELLAADKYKEALALCKVARKKVDFVQQLRDKEFDDDVQFYMALLHYIFFDLTGLYKNIQNQEFKTISAEEIAEFDTLTRDVDVLQHFVPFLRLIDTSLHKMVDLLETTSITDMHEAIDFFISMYKFNIDGADVGISKMLQLMRRNEQERKDAVVKAFETIYLYTETKNLADHCRIVLARLLKLLSSIPVTCLDDLQEIVIMWCSNGVLDNALIELLWRYALKTEVVTDDDSIAAIELLRMCALGRKTIIQKNMEVVVDLASSPRSKNNMKLLGACCDLLATAFEPVDILSDTGPMKIPLQDFFFTDLITTLVENFFKRIPFYHKAMLAAIDFIYKMCEKPELLCEGLLTRVVDEFVKRKAEMQKLPVYPLIRLCQLCGCIALKHLVFMDSSVYKELKRQQNMAEKKNETDKKKQEKRKTKNKDNRKSTTPGSASRASTTNVLNTSMEEDGLEGAVAEDTDADFILHVLEKGTVTGSGVLAAVTPVLVTICEKPGQFDNNDLQAAAVTALMRYMLVSSNFCQKHIPLIFTIFDKTKYPDVKTNILLHISDLLTRYPNLIEPWTPRLFKNLKDPDASIRRSVFFFMSMLMLKDVIRPHSHIPEMATAFLDESEEIRGMCRTFFTKLAHKENNLYNALPDVFNHLSIVVQEDAKMLEFMKFLFELIDNAKHMESLVDRFCGRFKVTEELRQQRNIASCLTYVKYNDRSFKKLIDNFPNYRHIIQDEEIYNSFKVIMQNFTKQAPGPAAAAQAGKANSKQLATEMEGLIKSVFDMDENQMMPPPPAPRQKKKRTASERKKKKSKRSTSSDEDSD
ncbi:unnamed protein product [Callosobruchus maculatus]|uniref:Condensin complex subunit 1 n=3 Tax=Callosobruchus maculatus TaxID=64391 RepID=A0A653D3P6_CALMS|nr:unnamed protein product [Callosobruchus maculatus]